MSEFISAAALLMAAAAVIVGSAALGLALRVQGRTGDGQAGEASPGTAPGEASPGAVGRSPTSPQSGSSGALRREWRTYSATAWRSLSEGGAAGREGGSERRAGLARV